MIVLRYKVGDTVKIREDLVEGDLEVNDKGVYVNSGMMKLIGKTAKVTEVLDFEDYNYVLDIDGGDAWWSDEMLEGGTIIKEYSTMEVIELIRVNPALKFKHPSQEFGNVICMIDSVLVWEKSKSPFKLTTDSEHFIDTFNLKWTVVEQQISVTFMEAAKAFEDDKIVTCKYVLNHTYKNT